MTKYIRTTLLIFLSIAVLSACGGPDTPTDASTLTEPQAADIENLVSNGGFGSPSGDSPDPVIPEEITNGGVNFSGQFFIGQTELRWDETDLDDLIAYNIRRAETQITDFRIGKSIYRGRDVQYIDTSPPLADEVHYRLFFEFGSGDVVASETIQLRTLTSINDEPPENVTDVEITNNGDSLTLSWINPFDDDLRKIYLYRDSNASIDTTTATPYRVLDQHTLLFTDTQVTHEETYYYALVAEDSLLNRSSGVELSFQFEDTIAPTASALFEAIPSANSVYLNWFRSPSTDIDHYTILRHTSRYLNYDELSPDNSISTTNLSSNDIGLVANSEYRYSLFAVDTAGIASEAVTLLTATSDKERPPSPANFDQFISDTVEEGKISLEWETVDPTTATELIIVSSTQGIVNSINNLDSQENVELSIDTTRYELSYDDNALRYISLFAVNADGDFSFPATLEAYPKDNSAPPIATSFSAAATDLGIQLSWSTPAESTASAPYDVVIQWSTSSCPINLSMGQQLVRQPSTITTILHSSATPEQTYFYSIFTVDSFNNVTTSDVLCRQATALPINSLPQLINLQALPGDGEVQFSWDLFDDADNELRVYFQHNVQPDVALDDESMTVFYTSSTETNFTHPDLTNGETQNYWIYIENTITNERTSITKLSLTPYDNLPPLQLQNVSATPSKQSILLQWNEDNLTDARQVIISMSSTSAPQKSSSGRQIYNQEPGRSTTVNVEDLMEDTQYYFSFFTLDAQNNESAPVTLYTKTKDTNPPSRPGGLIAYPADNRILLQWNESIDDDINTVQIIRNENPDLTLEDDAIFDLNGQLESFSDTTVINNVDYNYAVYFIDESGLKSEAAIVSATPIDTIAPPKVINVTSGETDFTVDLQWQNPIVTDASQIIIRYQSGNIPNPSPFGETNSIELLPPLPESYQITDLNNDQVYAFSIFTLDSSSNFEGFESILATPSTTAPSPPATDFNATGEDSLVRLTWENPPSNYTGINIYRSTDSYADALTSAIRITAEPLPVGQTSYVDTGLPNGITYYYALVNTGDNDPSTPAQASAIPVDQTEPFPITSLTAVPSDRQIQFNWVDPSDADLSHILIRRGELDFPLSILDGTLVDEVPNGIQTVTDTDLENGDIYFYAFFAIDTNGYASQRVTLALAAKDTIPPAPVTGASVSHDNGQVTLNWTNPTDADLSRIVIRRSDSAFPVSATTGFSVASLDDGGGTIPTTYTDSGLTNDEDYFYSLFALDENNNASTAVTLTGLPADVEAPPSIYSLTVTELDGQIDFSWQTPLSVDFDRVVLLRRNDIYPVSFDDGSAQLIYDGTGTNVSDSSGITNGIDYYYRFFTLDTYNNASVLDVLTGPQDLTPPGLPACIICTYGDTSISLTWTDPTDADLLRIHVRRSTLSPPATIDDGTPFVAVLPGVQSFSDSGLTNGTPYFYALFSEDTSGNISPPYAVTPLTPADEIPTAAPHTGSVASNEGSVTLNWLNPTDDDFTKVVIRKDPTSYPTTLDEGTLVAELTLGETTYTDLGVTDGEDYYYSLFALDEIPNTSAPLNLFGQPRDITAPPPVTGQSATGLDARIDLTWVNPIHPDFDRVLVLRKQGSFPSDPTDATAVVIYEGALQSVNDLDSLTNFTAYNYRIFSLDVFDNYSSSDVVGTPIDLTPPGLVTCTSCTPGDEQAILTWTNPADSDLAAIRIRRSDSGYPTSSAIGDVVADLLLGETTYTDSGLTNLTPYYYSIFTEDNSGNTSAAFQVPTITPIDNTLPAAVSTLTTTSVNQQITLQWNNPGDDTVEVHIYRDTVTYPATTSDGTLISSVIISGVNDSYTDSTVITDTPYFTVCSVRMKRVIFQHQPR